MAASACEPGTQFGPYRVVRLIGWGGMGEVYEAVHLGLDKHVALKTLHRGFTRHGSEVLDSFMQEGRTASRIKHPHIVDVTDMGVDGGIPYLVMELMEGMSLAERLGEGPLSETDAVDLLIPVLDALQCAHQAGVIHRDLKPENIFLARGRRGIVPKVLDFGISKLIVQEAEGTPDGSQRRFGTPSYMAPELLDAAAATPSSDLYAVGAILYEALTGELAFPPTVGDTRTLLRAVASGDFRPPTAVRAGLSVELEAVILSAMAADPVGRHPRAHSMLSALLPFASEQIAAQWRPVVVSEGLNTIPPAALTPEPRIGAEIDGEPCTTEFALRASAPLHLSTVDPNETLALDEPESPSQQRRVLQAYETLPLEEPLLSSRQLPVADPHETLALDEDEPEPASQTARAVSLHETPSHAAPASLPSSPEARWKRARHIAAVSALSLIASAYLFGLGGQPAVVDAREVPSSKPSTTQGVRPRYEVDLVVEPAHAEIVLDGAGVGTGRLRRSFAADDAVHQLTLRASGYEAHELEFSAALPPPANLHLRALASEPSRPEPVAEARQSNAKKRTRATKQAQPKTSQTSDAPQEALERSTGAIDVEDDIDRNPYLRGH